MTTILGHSSESWLQQPIPGLCQKYREQAFLRQQKLTKPPGSLGRLESLAIALSSMQKTLRPNVDRVNISVFAADHGVTMEGVSLFPQSVTGQMVKNFIQGGAAINILASQINAELEVVDVGVVSRVDTGDLLVVDRAGPGTRNIVCHEAMTKCQLDKAMGSGRRSVERAYGSGCNLFIGGEMGIGNTTSASAMLCVLLDESLITSVGPGTGLNDAGVRRKQKIVQQAVNKHRWCCSSPLSILRCLGGFEIAALVAAYLRCAQLGIPVLVDGFIASVAALVAVQIQTESSQWFLYSHYSQEPGHRSVLSALKAKPLVDFSMRLGEASGAALVVPLIRAACALQNDMATFDQAHVSPSIVALKNKKS